MQRSNRSDCLDTVSKRIVFRLLTQQLHLNLCTLDMINKIKADITAMNAIKFASTILFRGFMEFSKNSLEKKI